MKFLDYGKMAVTFLNLKTNCAVRVIAKEESKQRAKEYFPEIEDKYAAQVEAYKIMSDDELFEVQDVIVHLKPEIGRAGPQAGYSAQAVANMCKMQEKYGGAEGPVQTLRRNGYYEPLRQEVCRPALISTIGNGQYVEILERALA